MKSPAAAVGARVSKPLQNFFGALADAAPHSTTYWCRQKSKKIEWNSTRISVSLKLFRFGSNNSKKNSIQMYVFVIQI